MTKNKIQKIKKLTLVFIIVGVVCSFFYITFYLSTIRSKAAIEGNIHIEPEQSANNSSLVISDISASQGKYIRFIRLAITPTPTTANTPKPTTVQNTPTPPKATATIPPIQTGKGIWISKEEIMALPTTGAAWTNVTREANGSWGTANLGDNNSSHDVKTLAGALVAVRMNDEAMRKKTIEGLQSAMNSPLSRALELSRGLQTYVIAADIIGYRTPEFEQWVRKMLNEDVSPHNGGSTICNQAGSPLNCSNLGGVQCTAYKAPNNWGGHARASVIAAALYLNDQQILEKAVNAHKTFIGLDVPNYFHCQDTNWHADSANRYGVNKQGATINGTNVSGVLPEDWRRGAEYKWPPSQSGYMWEGMQGYVVSAVMLHRAGLVPFNAGENAVVRSMNMLYGRGEAAQNSPVFVFSAENSGGDSWIPWLVNYYAGTNFPTSASVSGKNMGYTDWTHAARNVYGVSDSQVLAGTACPQVDPSLSRTSMKISSQDAVYRVWSRMRAGSSGGNAFWIQIDTACPVKIGDNASITREWTWTSHTALGDADSSYSVSLSEGDHDITFYGDEVGVELDKVLLTQNITCIPEGFGTNCEGTNATPTVFVTPTVVPNCPKKSIGDADCNDQIDTEDFIIWKDEFTRKKATKNADFSRDNIVSIRDFEIWRQNIRHRDE